MKLNLIEKRKLLAGVMCMVMSMGCMTHVSAAGVEMVENCKNYEIDIQDTVVLEEYVDILVESPIRARGASAPTGTSYVNMRNNI